jgi:hypothetical protein
LRAILIAILLLVGAAAAADEIKAPKLSIATVDWDAARAALNEIEAARRLSATAHAAGVTPDLLERLNKATGTAFPNIAASPVPVLLPFDLDAYLRQKAGEETDYLAGFGAPKFFLTGPAGYDASFAVPLSESNSRNVEIHVSGFGFLYDLPARSGGEEKPVNGLHANFPDMRRLYFEGRMRYLFVRYGVLYEVSVECFDGVVRRRRLPCQDAHDVAARMLKALSIAGGLPQTISAPKPDLTKARPTASTSSFSYYAPGELISGTSARRRGGDADYTVYAPIRFPLLDAPGQLYSQMYINLGDCTAAPGDSKTLRRNGAPFRCLPGKTLSPEEMPRGGQNTYPWRDTFCESRAYFVGRCPTGLGHQGQDIVPVGCARGSATGECDRRHHQVVAVHDGAVLRAPGQESLIVVANAAGTHILFRYLHMNPKVVDAGGFFNGRAVREGEVIGKVSNYNGRAAGTSYHLHFDMQVPTKDGWVLVNPYMTLVTAYERLLGDRGMEIREEAAASSAADINDAVATPIEYRTPWQKVNKRVHKKRFGARSSRQQR